MNFTLERQQVLLANFSARSEGHGEDREPAADLKIEMIAPNDILAEFDPDLKSSLFRRPNADGDQLELVDQPGYLPKLRFPKMGAISWDEKAATQEFTVHIGRTELKLIECSVDKFSFEPSDGGQVKLCFRVQCKPDERQAGKLYTLVQRTIEVSLGPMPQQPSIDKSGELAETTERR